jgi:putative spermidine/putrescine transport system ATP-binding protein
MAPPADAPLVLFEGVRKSYDGRTDAVHALDFSVARGEFVTLLGPSGSGKTTTLMMLAGFEDPTAGRIVLDGRPINDVPAHRRGIGVVFQNYALLPHMTVAGNLSFPLEMRGVARAEREKRVAEALDMVRLGHLADRRPAQLSGGQQQRVALARALVFRPALVLMDEPLGALDKQLRERMQLEIRRIHRMLGVTVVYVTHDQGEALTMSDRVAVFDHGRIRQFAPPAEVYDEPADAFVASFIGENNALPGRIVARDDAWCSMALADGTTLRARCAPGLAPGDAAVLALRPERVLVGPEAWADNALEAELLETVYFGDHTRLRLRVGGHDEFVARLGFRDGIARPRPGDRIRLAWSAACCRALAPEPAE